MMSFHGEQTVELENLVVGLLLVPRKRDQAKMMCFGVFVRGNTITELNYFNLNYFDIKNRIIEEL
jgi:hypothetical protein